MMDVCRPKDEVLKSVLISALRNFFSFLNLSRAMRCAFFLLENENDAYLVGHTWIGSAFTSLHVFSVSNYPFPPFGRSDI